jgi:hypothetical protein
MFKFFNHLFSEEASRNRRATKEYRRMDKIFSEAQSREHLEVLMKLYDEGKL